MNFRYTNKAAIKRLRGSNTIVSTSLLMTRRRLLWLGSRPYVIAQVSRALPQAAHAPQCPFRWDERKSFPQRGGAVDGEPGFAPQRFPPFLPQQTHTSWDARYRWPAKRLGRNGDAFASLCVEPDESPHLLRCGSYEAAGLVLVRQKVWCDLCAGVQQGLPDQHACASSTENHALWHDDGCWAEKSACS